MTLEELIRQKNICGRIFRADAANDFIFQGIVSGVSQEGIVVHISVKSFRRRFRHRRIDNTGWNHLPDHTMTVGKNVPVEVSLDGTVSFFLPREGGRVYLSLKEKPRKAKEKK